MSGGSDGGRGRRNVAPSIVDLFFVALALAIPLRWNYPLLNADGDLAIHIRMGETILRDHAIPFVDRFSFTMAGQPLIPTAWLSEVLYALVNRAAGLPGVTVFTGLVIALTYALVVAFLRRRRVDGRLVVIAGLFSVLLGAIHWLPRPHIFTILGSAVLIQLLERERQTLWPYALLFLLWSNLHGGFVYGLVVLGGFLAGDVAEWWMSPQRNGDTAAAAGRGADVAEGGADVADGGADVAGGGADLAPPAGRAWWKRRARRHALALAVGVVASLANPGGVLLLRQIAGSLGSSHMVDTTVEYRSPNFHLFGPQTFLAVVLLLVVVLARGRRRMPYPWLATLLLNLFFALFSVRNIPLFGVTALPLLTLHAARVFPRRSRKYRFGDDFVAIERRSIVGVWSVPTLAAVLALALNHGRVAGAQLIPTSFHKAHFPIEAVEAGRAARLDGRMFTEFIWAGYVIYAWPEQRVFASSQKYTDPISADYLKIYYLEPGWRAALDRWRIQILMLPRLSPLANEVGRESGWTVWHCDPTAIVYTRVGYRPPPAPPVTCPEVDPKLRGKG